ncbi:MAG: ACT domain-containing protein [Epulopiscium sp.]|nr:ACT domain-containing protein [Candidatus Epulonipiscium sp.]
MLMKQISVFVQNQKGRLAKITRILTENGVNISGTCLADTTEFGILRMVVDKPNKALEVIKEAGFTVNTTEIFAVAVPHTPGGLNEVLNFLDEEDIGIEYLYSFTHKTIHEALILFCVDDPKKAIEVLQEKGIKVLNQEEVFS